MSEEDNKAMVRRFMEQEYQQAAAGNLDVIHQYYADNYRNHTPIHPQQSGMQGMKEVIADLAQATPDLRWKVEHIAAEGDLVFAHVRATGTHERQHQITKHVRHLEPSGEEGTVSGIFLYRIEGGKFVEGWYYLNVLEYAMAQSQGGVAAGSS
jgi:predicted SnoaL-like aldol condensation-catalyzing enzyme